MNESPATSREEAAFGPTASSGLSGSGAIAACVLLAGGLRASPLVLATGRSVLDLYATETRSVLDVWLARLEPLGRFPIRVVHGGEMPAPTTPPRENFPELSVEREPQGFRGPAGVLRDLCADYLADSTVLVGEGARFVSCDLIELVREHKRRNADATVGVSGDGSPAGVFAIRRSSLDLVNRVGFMDLKEQWLNKVLESGGSVFAHDLRGHGALPLRTRTDLLEAARVASGLPTSVRGMEPVWATAQERGGKGFSVVCAGARVAGSAFVRDAVVMPGAEVGDDAIVVRSVVAPGVRVENGSELIDVVAGASGARSDEWSTSTKRLRAER